MAGTPSANSCSADVAALRDRRHPDELWVRLQPDDFRYTPCRSIRAIALVAALAVLPAFAQPAAEERIDTAVRDRVIAADDAGSLWIAGQFETLDVAARVHDFAGAAERAPSERLFLTSLATACLERTQPTLPGCASGDPIAKFAARDTDNALPWLFLAERSRRRNDSTALGANLDRAALQPRFDDYRGRAGPVYLAVARAAGGSADPTAALLATLRFVAALPSPAAVALDTLCPLGATAAPNGATCARVGALMAARATQFDARAAGAALAERFDPTPAGREQGVSAQRDARLASARCAEMRDAYARDLVGGDAARRARATSALEAWLVDAATRGEVAACERLG